MDKNVFFCCLERQLILILVCKIQKTFLVWSQSNHPTFMQQFSKIVQEPSICEKRRFNTLVSMSYGYAFPKYLKNYQSDRDEILHMCSILPGLQLELGSNRSVGKYTFCSIGSFSLSLAHHFSHFPSKFTFHPSSHCSLYAVRYAC